MGGALALSLACFVTLAPSIWAVSHAGTAQLINGHSAAFSQLTPASIFSSRVPGAVRFGQVRERGILVSGWFNGVGPFTLAVDTGAGITIVSERVVSETGLTTKAGRRNLIAGLSGQVVASDRVAVVNSIALGDKNNHLPSRIEVMVASQLPSGVDGILDPTEAYSPYGYSIDLPNRLISAFDPRLEPLELSRPPADGTVVRWVRDRESRRPFVRLEDGRLALLDTGSGFGLAVTQDSALEHPRPNPARVRDVSGASIQSRRIAPTTVTVGSLVLRGIPTDLLTGVQGNVPVILGRDALYPFRLTFDPLNRLIEIAPQPHNGN